MIITKRLGALPSRIAILRGAANELILLQQLEPYPKGTWKMTPEAVHVWVAAILTRANSEAEVFEYPAFTVAEAINELARRGYVAQPDQPPLTVIPDRPLVVEPPIDQVIPPRAQRSTFPWWILLLMAAALLLREKKPKRRRSKKGLSGLKTENSKLKTQAGLSGELMNCAVWDETPRARGGMKWSCMMFAPAPQKPPTDCVKPNFPKQKKICVKMQKVSSMFYAAGVVNRCKKYRAACEPGATLSETMPKPHEASPGHYIDPEEERRIEKEVRSYAEALAKQENEMQEGPGKAFGREIMSRGGLRQHRYHRGAAGKEEFQWVPLFMRRKGGLPPDEMASEMGITENELMRQIQKHYPGITKIKRRYTWQDFDQVARDTIHEAYGRFSGLAQGDLFPGLKRELVLTAEDPATSDDPLTICLERAGWSIKRIDTLRNTIIEKRQPDLFTGKTVALNRSEKELETATQKCLETGKGFAGLGFMSTEHIAEGVRKGVRQNKERMKHGDTGLNAFFVTPSMNIIPWREREKLTDFSTSVHSHSASNWNELLRLSGQKEPPFRFSDGDIKIFRDGFLRGEVDTDALIMADGRMITVQCPMTSDLHLAKDEKIDRWQTLPQAWNSMRKYEGMTSLAAAQKRQGEFFRKVGCKWTLGRWREEGETTPDLVQPLTSERMRAAGKWAKFPPYIYTKKPGGEEYDLTKAMWLRIPGWMYPTEPAQPELFKQRRRQKRAPTGERTITVTREIRPDRPPVQMRFFGTRRANQF